MTARPATRTSTVSVSRGMRRFPAAPAGGAGRGSRGGPGRFPGRRPAHLRRANRGGRGAAPRRAADRDVVELGARGGRAQQEAAPAHVAASDEGRGERQARSERAEQRIDVLAGGHAPEQDHLVGGRERSGEPSRVAQERRLVARLARADVGLGEALQAREVHRLVREAQPIARRDDEDAGQAGRRRGEGARIGRACRGNTGRSGTRRSRRASAPAPRAGVGRGRSGRVGRRAGARARPTMRRREQKEAAHARPLGDTARTNASVSSVLSTSPRRTHPRRAIATP